MKKLYIIVIASVLVVFVFAFGFNASFLNKNSATSQTTSMTMKTSQSSLFSSSFTRAGKDHAAEPLTMLIFGTCLAGAATLGRRHHK